LTAISQEKETIFLWLENIKEMGPFVRIVPLATDALKHMYFFEILGECFDQKIIEKELDKNVESFLHSDVTTDRFALYMEPNRKMFFEESQYLSLPTCYIRVNEKQLYLSNGKKFITPTREQAEELLMKKIREENPEFSEKEVQEKMQNKSGNKLDEYFTEYRGLDHFLTITPCEYEEKQLDKICNDPKEFISHIDLEQLDWAKESKKKPESENKCSTM
jgi:hypothetical protein